MTAPRAPQYYLTVRLRPPSESGIGMIKPPTRFSFSVPCSSLHNILPYVTTLYPPPRFRVILFFDSPSASYYLWDGSIYAIPTSVQIMTRNIPRNGLEEAIREKSQFAASPNVIVPRSHNKAPSIIPFQEQEWNTKDLPWRITSDVTAAACASGCVAPVITIIDR